MFSKTTTKLLRAFWRVVTGRGLVGELLPLKTQRAANRIQLKSEPRKTELSRGRV